MSAETAAPITAPGDRDERLRLWHSPRAATVLDVVAVPAAAHPDLTPLWFSNDGRTAEPLTWSALWNGKRSA